MVSGRTADLARCGIEGALEVDCLAYTLKLAQERGANMSCEVKPVEGLIAARQQNRYHPRPPKPHLPCPSWGLVTISRHRTHTTSLEVLAIWKCTFYPVFGPETVTRDLACPTHLKAFNMSKQTHLPSLLGVQLSSQLPT